jgi:hypothetical protein
MMVSLMGDDPQAMGLSPETMLQALPNFTLTKSTTVKNSYLFIIVSTIHVFIMSNYLHFFTNFSSLREKAIYIVRQESI